MTYRTIVFAYDGSAEGQAALAEGIELASLVGARCHLLAVMSVPPEAKYAQVVVPEDCLDEDYARINHILEEGIERFRNAGLEVDGVVRVGEAAPVIGEYAEEVHADLVVVGHRRRGPLDRWWHGSVGHSLLDTLPCSLLVAMKHQEANA
ncbi:MAG: hypothetical protein PWQ19_370 [Tepidiphilus sp.]|nr:hypothetical protein [Tepidiphilus sp.]